MSSQQSNDNQKRQTRPPPPALDIQAPALTQPFKDFVSRGLCEIRCIFTPTGVRILCVPYGPLRMEGETEQTVLPYGEIRRRIEERGLATVRKARGQKSGQNNQPLPMKSLTEEDFKGSDDKLLVRIRAVATALGPDVARSRVLTHKLNVNGEDDFEAFWASANADVRSKLLMDKKHATKVGPLVSKLVELRYPCPFRGPLSPPQAKKTDEEQKAESSEGKGKQPANGVKTPPKSPPKPGSPKGSSGKGGTN